MMNPIKSDVNKVVRSMVSRKSAALEAPALGPEDAAVALVSPDEEIAVFEVDVEVVILELEPARLPDDDTDEDDAEEVGIEMLPIALVEPTGVDDGLMTLDGTDIVRVREDTGESNEPDMPVRLGYVSASSNTKKRGDQQT
jgi:hypothetical protein